MSGIETEAALILAPTVNRVAVFTTSTTTLITTLSATDQLGIVPFNHGKYVTLHADGGDVYFYFASTSSVTASGLDTGISGTSRAWKLADGEERSYVISRDAGGIMTRIHHLSSAAAKLRAYVSSARTSNIGGNETP